MMSRWPDTPRKKSRIEIIPMIDVMMFLLVFFVLISLNVIPALGLKTKLPQSSQAKDERPPLRVIVTLPKVEGIQVDGENTALGVLADKLEAKRKASGRTLSVLINGDESVELQRLIDVMDVLKARGFDSLSIAARKR
jgi:biopolymer transport protein ExbD